MHQPVDIVVDRHIRKLFFDPRRYSCEIISRSHRTAYVSLNNSKIVTLLAGTNEQCNPVTAVFPYRMPDFFKEKKYFHIQRGRCYSDDKMIYLNPIDHSSKKINDIKFDPLNKQNISALNSYVKKTDFAYLDLIKINIEKMEKAWKKNNPGKFYENLTDIAGLGEGLTPSTDDFICGTILVMKLLIEAGRTEKIWNPPFLKTARVIYKKTGRISWYYIVLAMMGYVSDWQFILFEKLASDIPLKEEELENINYGHTSSKDFLCGVDFMFNLFSGE
ncbi:MAG: DUF2877 domain-containing protein [Armatimonadota bacterium]